MNPTTSNLINQTTSPWLSLINSLNCQQAFFDDDNNITMYRSGVSSISDLLGYIDANKPIGVCITDCSSNVRNKIAEYADLGGQCFIDSGAFRTFNNNLKNNEKTQINFDKVFDLYASIASQCTQRTNLTFVMPDVIGNQHASMDLLKTHFDKIERFKLEGAKILIPIQSGILSLAEYYQKCIELFGDSFTVGLPSNAKAITEGEVLEFIENCKPKAVHFLGTNANSVIYKSRHISPTTTFSCDSTTIRKHIGNNRLITECQRELTTNYIEGLTNGVTFNYMNETRKLDESDFLENLESELASFSSHELKSFAKELNLNVNELKAAIEDSDVWSFLDLNLYGRSEYFVQKYFEKASHKEISPSVRREIISSLATRDIN